jgi:hypothetical protein
MSRDHESWATNDGNNVMVPNPNEMISTTAPVDFSTSKFCNVIWFKGISALDRGGGLNAMYHSRYIYVMCCECVDSDVYRH